MSRQAITVRAKTYLTISLNPTVQKMKCSIKDFFSKCDQIRKKLRIWPHLLKKSLMENFIFCPVSSLPPAGIKLQDIL